MSNWPPPDPDQGQQPPGGWSDPQAPPQPPAAPYTPHGGYAAPGTVNPFDSESTPILVTGILSLVLCGPVGIYSWIKGNELRDRARAAGWPEPSTAKVGRILGIIGTVIFGAWIVLAVLWFVFAILIIGGTAATST